MKNIINKFKEGQIKRKIKAYRRGEMENISGTGYLEGAVFAEEHGYPGNAIKLSCLYAKEHIDNGNAYWYASNVAHKNGAGEKAIYLAKKFANSYGNKVGWIKVAQVELDNSGDLKEAISDYEQVLNPPEIISWLKSSPFSKYHKDLNREILILKEKNIVFQEERLKKSKRNYESLERELKSLRNN